MDQKCKVIKINCYLLEKKIKDSEMGQRFLSIDHAVDLTFKMKNKFL